MRKYIKSKIDSSNLESSNAFFKFFFKQKVLFYVNRRSCSKAFAIGLFWAMQPMPFQMIPAAIFSFLFRSNILIAIVCVWITNPLTMGPIMIFNYFIGCFLMGIDGLNSSVFVYDNLSSILNMLLYSWKPLFLGSFFIGVVFAVIGYFGNIIAWRIYIAIKIKAKKKKITDSL
jgi:uncharacterized protein (DUF2062 family)